MGGALGTIGPTVLRPGAIYMVPGVTGGTCVETPVLGMLLTWEPRMCGSDLWEYSPAEGAGSLFQPYNT